MTLPKRRNLARALVYLTASMPLWQLACTTDALRQSLATEVTTSAAQFVFGAAQTVFMNFFRL